MTAPSSKWECGHGGPPEILIKPTMLTEDTLRRARDYIERMCMIKQPVVETGEWLVTGDPAQGYGLLLREYPGVSMPEIPVPPDLVRELQIAFLREFLDFSSLHQFRNVERLWVAEPDQLLELSFVRTMPRLQFFRLSCTMNEPDYSALRGNTSLRELELFGVHGVEDLTFLTGCEHLECLTISGTSMRAHVIDFLHHHLPALRHFKAHGLCHDEADLDRLRALHRCRPEMSIESSNFMGDACLKIEGIGNFHPNPATTHDET